MLVAVSVDDWLTDSGNCVRCPKRLAFSSKDSHIIFCKNWTNSTTSYNAHYSHLHKRLRHGFCNALYVILDALCDLIIFPVFSYMMLFILLMEGVRW